MFADVFARRYSPDVRERRAIFGAVQIIFMKNIIAVTFFIFFVSLNCFAQCEKLESFSINSFIDSQRRVKERKKRKPEKIKIEREIVTSSGTIRINGNDGSDIDFDSPRIMTWGIGFSEGLAKITVNEKSGFINRGGQIVIKPKYTIVNCFSEGLAAVEINGKWGFINQKGEITVPAKFDAAGNFSEGLALVKVGELWGYIRQDGDFAIAPTYEEAGSFSEDTAVVSYFDKDYVWTSHKRPNGKWFYNFIDQQGKLKFPSGFDGISRNFNSGMALVSRNIGFNNGVISESYFINKEGKELWIYDSWFGTWFSEDMIIVAVDRDEETKRDKYSFLNRNGKRVTDKVYDYLSAFSEGLAVAGDDEKYGSFKYGFINKEGEFVIEPQFADADGFSEGLAAVEKSHKVGFADKEGGKVGFIDRSANWIIRPQFDWADNFQKGVCAVAISEKVGYINRNGNYIWKPTK